MARPTRPAEDIGDRDRWLALGLLLALLAVAYAILIHPWWTVPMLEAGARVESLQQRELRQRMQLQQAPQVAQRLAEVFGASGGGASAEASPPFRRSAGGALYSG